MRTNLAVQLGALIVAASMITANGLAAVTPMQQQSGSTPAPAQPPSQQPHKLPARRFDYACASNPTATGPSAAGGPEGPGPDAD